MSAITGIFYRDGRKVDPELMKKMNDRLSHRGPDGSSIWCEGPVGLGHQMLWTTPESLHEKLPFNDERSGLVITADARIDNRKELSEELGIEDKEDVSDSYFILKAYEKWGEDCPDKLLGDFAFAIWDKNEEKFFCARDHMGVKPFYYYLDDDMFVFGTEIKALFCIEKIPKELNEEKVVFHLMGMNLDKKLTFYSDIFSLTAANLLKISENTIKLEKYWEIDPESKIIMDSDEEYLVAFRKIFRESVNCRLRNKFQTGFQLSGGLDSSSIVCMAEKILDDNYEANYINTFSYIFKDFPETDESIYIEKIINSRKIKPHFLDCNNISPLKGMENILNCQDQPFYSVTIAIGHELFKLMNQNNIRVILAGHGGDEVISYGQGHLQELFFTLKWQKFTKELYLASKNYNVNFFKAIMNLLIYPLSTKIFKKINIHFRKSKIETDSILNEKIADKFGGKQFLNNLKKKSIDKSSPKMYHYSIINNFSHQYILELIDRMAAQSSIEPRYPFFDKRLVEFCYAIPTDIKFKLGWDRYILRAGMGNLLPDEIKWRPRKKYFDSYYKKNLLLFEKEILDEINTDNKILKNIVNLEIFKNDYKNYKKKNENVFDLWLVTILYLWLKNLKKEEIMGLKDL